MKKKPAFICEMKAGHESAGVVFGQAVFTSIVFPKHEFLTIYSILQVIEHFNVVKLNFIDSASGLLIIQIM